MTNVGAIRNVLTFDRWNPDVGITRDGKHIYSFPQSFPLVIFSYSFPYYYSNVPNYHEYFEISYNCAGTGVYHVSNREYSFQDGDVAVIGSDELHYLRASTRSNLNLFSIFFRPELVCPPTGDESTYELVRPFVDGAPHVLRALEYDHARLLRTMLEMYRLETLKPRYYRLHLKHQLVDLLLQLLHHYDLCHLFHSRASPRAAKGEANVHRLNPVFNLVENHYRERITLTQAARLCNMSRNYFCRFYRTVTGTSFLDYLNKFRINRAKELIIDGDLTRTQVAYQVGYNNLGYFYRAFRKYVHLSPGEYITERES